MDLWAHQNNVHLDLIRPGRPVENGYIESFNGRLRDECLNVEVFFTLADAAESWITSATIATTIAGTRHWRTEPRPSLQPCAAVEMTANQPPWKTLRVSHISPARRRLAMIESALRSQACCWRPSHELH